MLTVGLRREAVQATAEDDSAMRVSPLVPDVYASTRLIGLAEATCAVLMAEHLAAGETSVGTSFQFTHDAPTPIGMAVRMTVRLVEIDRRRCVFEIEAHDDVERIAAGRHERFVVDRAKFMARVAAKTPPRA